MNNIENLIKSHVEKLSGVTVAYQYSDVYEMHCLQIIPYSRFDDDAVFNAVQDIIDEHFSEFPSELWYVVTPESEIKMTNPSFVLERQENYSSLAKPLEAYYDDPSDERVTLLMKTIKKELSRHKEHPKDLSKGLIQGQATYAMAA